VPFRLTPRDNAFYSMFTEAGRNVAEATDVLAQLLDPNANREAVAKQLREREHAGDAVTHRIMRQLNTSFVTPFDREDIYALASGLDDVMDFMEEAVDLTLLYEVQSLPAECAEQVEVLQSCAELTAESMPKLQAMKDLEEYWIEINRLENAGDKSYRRILAKLFSGQYEALEVLKLKDIVDSLEHAVDAFEKVANIVEQIHAKES
jgi:predicted phosphate transport protein (TIGR00153 family)